MNYFLRPALLLGCILFFSMAAAAQKKVISIEYKRGLLPVEQYKGKSNEELANINFEPRLLKGITYELLITDQKSYFSLKEKRLINDAQVMNKRYREKVVVYVNNTTQEKISHRKVLSKTYLISHPFNNIDWKLINEHKTILGHHCRKATGKKPILKYNSKKDINEKAELFLIAWYAEDIPFSFGPYTFKGLPGVILEIIYGRYSYEATDISIRNKPANKQLIKKPTEGIPIKHAEMVEEIEKVIQSLRE